MMWFPQAEYFQYWRVHRYIVGDDRVRVVQWKFGIVNQEFGNSWFSSIDISGILYKTS